MYVGIAVHSRLDVAEGSELGSKSSVLDIHRYSLRIVDSAGGFNWIDVDIPACS